MLLSSFIVAFIFPLCPGRVARTIYKKVACVDGATLARSVTRELQRVVCKKIFQHGLRIHDWQPSVVSRRDVDNATLGAASFSSLANAPKVVVARAPNRQYQPVFAVQQEKLSGFNVAHLRASKSRSISL